MAALDVDAELDALGFRRFTLLTMCLCGLGWFADGLELTGITFLLPTLQEQWDLEDDSALV